MPIPVHERFYSFQGEGFHAGRAAFFIRTFGCPVHCPWCDSAGTWHPDHVPERVERFEPEALAEEAASTKADFAVVTGGEPAIHDLSALSDALHRKGLRVHLETSGAFALRGAFDWITLSPKRWKAPLAECVSRANEFKLIVDRVDAIEEYARLLRGLGAPLDGARPVWLHPEWSQRRNPQVLGAIVAWVKDHAGPFRAGWQLHKPYAADLADARSAPSAPLGGRPEQGF